MESILRQLILNQAIMQQHPQTSTNFCSPTALDWLDVISESNAILSTILAVIHPQLYDAGWQTARCLRDTPKVDQDVLSRWASVFSSISVISNCSTPLHWDGSLQSNWYNMLVTLGRYQKCYLKLPGLRVSLEYRPGMVVRVLGKVLEHAVPSFEGGRVCHEFFMRDGIHGGVVIPVSDWMHAKYCKWYCKWHRVQCRPGMKPSGARISK